MRGLPTYRQGRLLWARLRSRKGKKELHPCVIITPDRDIIQPEAFDPRIVIERVNAVAVVGVSSEFKKYPPYVSLPFSPKAGGHPKTGLSQECGACIGWYDWVVLEDDVEGCGGQVPLHEMGLIVAEIMVDLRRKLGVRAGHLSKELLELSKLLEALIGEP